MPEISSQAFAVNAYRDERQFSLRRRPDLRAIGGDFTERARSNNARSRAAQFAVVTGITVLGLGRLAVAAAEAAAPSFDRPPAHQTNGYGTTASFSATTLGEPPFVFTWLKDGFPIVDPNVFHETFGSSLTLPAVTKLDEGRYQLLVSNALGQVTSDAATLTVIDPYLILTPIGRARLAGESVTMVAAAVGTRPFAFQWWHDDLPIPWGTSFSLTLTNLALRDAGYYRIAVSNAVGTTFSPPAPLTINGINVDSEFNPSLNATTLALAPQADGKILVGGRFSLADSQSRTGLARFHPDGRLDGGFTAQVGGSMPSVVCLAVQNDSGILVGGQFGTLSGQIRPNLGRIDSSGNVDPSFAPNPDGAVQCILVQPDGRILVGGSFTNVGGQVRHRIARLHPGGTLDPSFDPGANNIVSTMALEPDGKILVGGMFTTVAEQPRDYLARLHPDGSLDSQFNPQAFNDLFPRVHSIAVQPDGRILVGGTFGSSTADPRGRLRRLNPNGSLDPTFNASVDHRVFSIALQADGKILIGGGFNNVGGQSRNYLARLAPDGSPELTFNPSPSNVVNGIALQANGRIVISGHFTSVARENRLYLARLGDSGAATQSLTYDGSTVTWLRGGTSPEAFHTTVEHSTNGADWIVLGAGTRTAGGWQFRNIRLHEGILRTRAYIQGSYQNASGWFDESRLPVPAGIKIDITRTNSDVLLQWTGHPGIFQIQSSSNPALTGSWQNLGAPIQTNSISMPIGPGDLFLRVFRMD